MASARAALGRARRGMIKRKKTAGVVKGALGAAATVTAFGAGQAKKADTAWKEYEAGYGEIPGADVADIKKPGFFKRTAQQILPGGKTGLPEGEVRVGATMYDRSKLQKAGAFLGSDDAAILDVEQRKEYLGRTAPGRAQTTEEIATTRKSLRPDMPYVEDEYDVDEEFDYDAYTAESPVYKPAPPKSMKPMILQGQEPGLATFGRDWETPQGGSYKEWKADQQLNLMSQGRGPGIDPNIQSLEGYDAMNQYRMNAYAKGGDFITNGPQKIVVGDNPGGRERVSIRPLSSEDDGGTGRFGDSLMKEKDGELVHISRREKNWSDEDLEKAVPFPTINPITGKKEYFLGAITGAALAIGSSLYKGWQATQNKGDVEAGQAAAGDIYQEQVQQLGQKKTAGLEQIKSQYTTGMEELALGTQMQTTDVQTSGQAAISKANLVSGSVEDKMQTQMKNLMAGHATTAKKQADTKKYAEAQEIFSFQSGQRSAEDVLQGTLTELESQPTTFLEGLFG